MEIDSIRLIEEVRKMPILWVCEDRRITKNKVAIHEQWEEIGRTLGADAFDCKREWQKLRGYFTNKANIMLKRIAKAKANGTYDPNKKYYSWKYFDHLRFVAKGRRFSIAKYDMSYICEPANEAEMAEFYPLSTGGDSNFEMVDCTSSDQTQSENGKYFQDTFEIVEFEEDTSLEQTKDDYFNASAIQSTRVVMEEPEPQIRNENYPVENDSSFIQNDDSAVKKEPEFQIEVENFPIENATAVKEKPEFQIETENVPIKNKNMTEFYGMEFSSSSSVARHQYNESSNLLIPKHEPDRTTCSGDQTSNLPDLKDEDYCFLLSFLTQMSEMTRLQKIEFQVRMDSLLLTVFPASSSANVTEKQLLLPEYTDKNKKFLMSFWPFMKSSTMVQNLQFRSKMVDLVLKISSIDVK